MAELAQKALALALTGLQALFFPFAALLTLGRVTTAALDCVPDSHYSGASARLSDPQASPQAKALLAWLQKQYGKHTLSGQFVSPYEDYAKPVFRDAQGSLDVRLTNELAALQEAAGGKLPAVLGLDFTGVEFIDYGQWDDWVTRFALQWHELGGIVTFCWHWLMPKDITKPEAEWSRWESAFNPGLTNFNLEQALADESGVGYQCLLRGIEKVAGQLQALKDAGVPVLWRPLHEAAGGWFWWGSSGAEAYLGLYNLLYDKLVGEYGLHNLIWVWNAQRTDWYPGDGRADILADDPYPPGNYKWLYPVDPARAVRFKYTRRADGARMVAMAENDKLPDLNMMWDQNVKWLYFCTWDREKLLKPDPDNQPYGYLREVSEEYDSVQAMRAMYNDARVLTLDEIGWR
ncbi:MAG: glycoside hydrolase family 26 protein [Oscillospiraceae bacterium]|nr:glycoside hydrolase family 26 protein [Oscillospiraceae bacterium]